MVLLNTFKLKHLPNKLTRYSSMNVVTPRIIIVVQVFESHETKKNPFWNKAQGIELQLPELAHHSYIHRELSSLFVNRYIPGPHVHLSMHVWAWCIVNTLDYLRFVISDSVDKSVELNKRSLDVRNSGSEKHERHDQLAIMDSCVRKMHTMRGSSKQNCSPYSPVYYNPQHYQLIMALSRRITLCNTSTLLLSTSF